MKIQVGGSSIQIERIGKDRLLVDGNLLSIDVQALETSDVRLTIDGRPLKLSVFRDQDSIKVRFDQETISVRVESSTSSGSETLHEGKETLYSRMPGKVLRIQVKPGDKVAAQQSLLVLEAMKMENEILSPAAGVVDSLHVQAGQAVGSNHPLLTLTFKPFP